MINAGGKPPLSYFESSCPVFPDILKLHYLGLQLPAVVFLLLRWAPAAGGEEVQGLRLPAAVWDFGLGIFAGEQLIILLTCVSQTAWPVQYFQKGNMWIKWLNSFKKDSKQLVNTDIITHINKLLSCSCAFDLTVMCCIISHLHFHFKLIPDAVISLRTYWALLFVFITHTSLIMGWLYLSKHADTSVKTRLADNVQKLKKSTCF